VNTTFAMQCKKQQNKNLPEKKIHIAIFKRNVYNILYEGIDNFSFNKWNI